MNQSVVDLNGLITQATALKISQWYQNPIIISAVIPTESPPHSWIMPHQNLILELILCSYSIKTSNHQLKTKQNP